jgi:predicted metal-dependent hydrolase
MTANQPTSSPATPAAFKREVKKWARRIGVHPKEIHLRQLKSKQASCSPKGRLTFNTELLYPTAQVRTEAIVHELLHLKVPNHSKLFKQLMNAFLTEYE